ncbi:MAG: restriction endonuclease [Acidobacteria bacterium]|nr:restriction endonuclease [Acidobacteriota bacterium]
MPPDITPFSRAASCDNQTASSLSVVVAIAYEMNLSMPSQLAANYKSPAQRARVVSEAWGVENLYCPNCQSPFLNSAPNNTAAFDYVCPRCTQSFQLKSKSSPFGARIVDAGYGAMMRAILEDRTPNLYALHYDRALWQVRNLILVPHFAFSSSAIEARKPLAAGARRAGWVGCNIVLKNIPPDARISLILNGVSTLPRFVRESFQRLQPFKEIGVRERGWTLDVLRIVRSLGKTEFSNSDVYAFAPQLEQLHPDNRHVRDKIRQQLQVLRDRGFLFQQQRGFWTISEQFPHP